MFTKASRKCYAILKECWPLQRVSCPWELYGGPWCNYQDTNRLSLVWYFRIEGCRLWCCFPEIIPRLNSLKRKICSSYLAFLSMFSFQLPVCHRVAPLGMVHFFEASMVTFQSMKDLGILRFGYESYSKVSRTRDLFAQIGTNNEWNFNLIQVFHLTHLFQRVFRSSEHLKDLLLMLHTLGEA